MTKEGLFKLIEQAGMHVVPLKGDDEPHNENYFDGDLEDFLRTAKAIGSTAVFVQTNLLELEHFNYQIEGYEELEDEEEFDAQENPAVDLTKIHPSLAEFKKFLGQEYNFSLSAKGGADELNLEWFAHWYCEFEEEYEKAREKADVQARAEEQVDEASQIKNTAKIKELVECLKDDPRFVKIKTLREMKLYALNKFPELEELEQDADFNAVQDAVRDIRDQINIKGLRN